MADENSKYVVLEGIIPGENRDERFYTSNSPRMTDTEKTKLVDGRTVYRIVGFADTPDEAKKMI